MENRFRYRFDTKYRFPQGFDNHSYIVTYIIPEAKWIGINVFNHIRMTSAELGREDFKTSLPEF